MSSPASVRFIPFRKQHGGIARASLPKKSHSFQSRYALRGCQRKSQSYCSVRDLRAGRAVRLGPLESGQWPAEGGLDTDDLTCRLPAANRRLPDSTWTTTRGQQPRAKGQAARVPGERAAARRKARSPAAPIHNPKSRIQNRPRAPGRQDGLSRRCPLADLPGVSRPARDERPQRPAGGGGARLCAGCAGPDRGARGGLSDLCVRSSGRRRFATSSTISTRFIATRCRPICSCRFR